MGGRGVEGCRFRDDDGEVGEGEGEGYLTEY
jgi:hypothetical protein